MSIALKTALIKCQERTDHSDQTLHYFHRLFHLLFLDIFFRYICVSSAAAAQNKCGSNFLKSQDMHCAPPVILDMTPSDKSCYKRIYWTTFTKLKNNMILVKFCIHNFFNSFPLLLQALFSPPTLSTSILGTFSIDPIFWPLLLLILSRVGSIYSPLSIIQT